MTIFKPFIERAWQTDFQIICKTLSKWCSQFGPHTKQLLINWINDDRRPPQPHLVTTSGLATQHTTMIRVAWSLLQVSIVESSSPLCRSRWSHRLRDMCTFIRDGFHANAFSCLILWLLPCLFFIVSGIAILELHWKPHDGVNVTTGELMSSVERHVYVHSRWWLTANAFLPHPLTSVLLSSSSYCIRYCYITNWRHVLPLLHRTVSGAITIEGMCTFIRNDGLLANAFSLPSPLTSVLLLLHRSRYCYSRASLVTTWELISEGTTLPNTDSEGWVWQKSKRRYELSELEAKLSGRWLPKWCSDTIDSDDE
jgi:hypothetical protein